MWLYGTLLFDLNAIPPFKKKEKRGLHHSGLLICKLALLLSAICGLQNVSLPDVLN